MLAHLPLFFLLLTLLTGFIALTFAGQLSRRNGSLLLRRHLILLALFTASVTEFYIFAYARTNIGQPAGWFFDLLVICRTYTNGAIIVAALLCFHELYHITWQRTLDRLIVGASIVGGSVMMLDVIIKRIPLNQMIWSPGITFGIGIYYALFGWFLVINLIYIWRLGSLRERFIGWGLFGFGLFGMFETLVIGTAHTVAANIAEPPRFYFSTIPWFLWSLATIFILPRLYPDTPKTAVTVATPSGLLQFAQQFTLSNRELQVLELLVAGHGNAAIADALCISLATVKSHVHNILGKCGVPSRFALVARIQSKG